MDFKRGSEVVSSEGDPVGTLRRVVIDPGTKKVAYIVIERGTLFTEDKLVPMDFVEKVTENQVILHEPKSSLDQLNEFEETHYMPLDENGEGLNAYYWNPPLSGITMGAYPVFPHPVYIVKTTSNIPENYVALKEGARVITEDGEHAGNLERVITDASTDQATHIVISSGFLLKEKKLVPAHWIKDVTEDEVHLSVESALLERLVDYQGEHR